jgi:primosomal protein N'
MSTTRIHLTADALNDLLRMVADRRSQGQDWEVIAAELKRPGLELRALIFEHEATYRPLLKKARREQKQICFDTALEILRQQAKSSNEKISHSAASVLARIEMVEKRTLAKTEKAKSRQQKKLTPAKAPLDPMQAQAVDKIASSGIQRNNYSILHTNPTIEDMVKRCLADERLNVDLRGKSGS